MYEGKHVLIVFDDLSKQAEAYRAVSLLLRRPRRPSKPLSNRHLPSGRAFAPGRFALRGNPQRVHPVWF